MNIRARRRSDLEQLQRAWPALAAYPIIESTPARDCAFRIVPVPRTVFADAMRDLVLCTDYVNFKSACSATPELDAEFQRVLHDVWAASQRLQR